MDLLGEYSMNFDFFSDADGTDAVIDMRKKVGAGMLAASAASDVVHWHDLPRNGFGAAEFSDYFHAFAVYSIADELP